MAALAARITGLRPFVCFHSSDNGGPTNHNEGTFSDNYPMRVSNRLNPHPPAPADPAKVWTFGADSIAKRRRVRC